MRNTIGLVQTCTRSQVSLWSLFHNFVNVNIAVNCPFMAKSYSSLNFDGQLRDDANHGMNPQYAPNSFTQKFRPDCAETPFQAGDNIVSRKSHFYHEGKPSEYDQARALYKNVMNDEARKHVHYNTARLLKQVDYPEIQMKYLAQLHAIDVEYAKGVFNSLPVKKFDFKMIKQRAQKASQEGKVPKFIPKAPSEKLGMVVPTPVYTA